MNLICTLLEESVTAGSDVSWTCCDRANIERLSELVVTLMIVEFYSSWDGLKGEAYRSHFEPGVSSDRMHLAFAVAQAAHAAPHLAVGSFGRSSGGLLGMVGALFSVKLAIDDWRMTA